MKPILPRRLSGGQHTQKPSAQAAQADALLRLLVAFILIVIFFSILLARFFYLQVTQHNEFSGQASSNRITLIPTPPVRGEIVDINGVPLAKNYPVFSLEVIPSRIEGKMEDVIEALKKYVDITPTDLKRFKKYRESYRKFENIPLKLKLTDEEAARLSVHLREFKGVEVNSRTFREYPYGKLTSHFLGYIGRISDKDKEMLEEEGLTALYRGSTHIGKSGLEKYYEHQLHGVPGYQEVEKDAYGNIVRVLKNVPSKMGQTLRLGMDIRMQQEADRILGDRRGALDVGATTINEEMKRACVYALADLAMEEVTEEVVAAYGKKFEFGAEYLIPTPFDSRLLPRVATATAKAAMESGVATRPIADLDAYAAKLAGLKL